MSVKLLNKRDLKIIKKWIRKVEKEKFESRKESRSFARKKLKKLSIEKMRSGSHRRAYDVGNGYVLKLALTVKGIKQNKKEAKIYKSASSSLKKHLAKVAEHGHGWVIMKKMDRMIKRNKKTTKAYKRLKAKFLKEGIIPEDLISKKGKILKKNNTRLGPNGQLVVIDYGNFKRKS